jgi:hypothetical protein
VHYIKGTYQIGTKCSSINTDLLVNYTDSDCMGDDNAMKLHMAMCFFLVMDQWFGHARSIRWYFFQTHKLNIMVQ